MNRHFIINLLSLYVGKQNAKKRRESKLSAIELLSKKYDKKNTTQRKRTGNKENEIGAEG